MCGRDSGASSRMTEFQIFGMISGLLLLAFGANKLFPILRVPDLVILLVVGLLLGPVLKWVDAQQFRTFTQILGSLALILILFEGGTELNLREGFKHFPGGVLLALLGYISAFAAVTATAHYTLWLPWRSALLLGAVFGCTSSTVIMPVLQQLKTREPVRVTLLLESALGDVFGVLCVTTLLASNGGAVKFSGVISGFAKGAGIASVVGISSGLLWWRLWPRVAHQRFSNTVAFGAVLGVYAATHAIGGTGLLAVLAFGLTLGNMPGNTTLTERQFLHFHSELSFLVRSFFFVLLGVIVEFTSRRYILPILGLIAALLLSRYLAVQLSRVALGGISPQERELVFLMMPRGLITAVLAVQVLQVRGSEFSFLPAMAFTAIVATNVLMVVGSVRAAKDVNAVTLDAALDTNLNRIAG